MSPARVYGPAWSTTTAAVDHVVVVVREPPGWSPPTRQGAALEVLESEGGLGFVHRHEAFYNGSLILAAEADKWREDQRYRRLFSRTRVSWINNCGTPDDLVATFVSAVMDIERGSDRCR